jgi:ATP-dependent RNA circularization protein (DNA/RNA ligase family)
MTTLLSERNLAKLNSLTKYPSILTYHALGENGRLTDTILVPFETEGLLTEKIDGTNARLICTPEGGLVGRREDLLWATGDLIHNPAMGIVAAVREHARALQSAPAVDALLVIYGEVYGRNVGAAAKQYTTTGQVGFRVFDAFEMPLESVFALLEQPIERISLWRENAGQPFLKVPALDALAQQHGFERVPSLGTITALEMPRSIAQAAKFLERYAKSAARLNESAPGHSEGVVMRSADRRQIAKLRFEDYRRVAKGK